MGRKIPQVLTIDEQERFIKIFNTRYFNSERNKVMIELFLNTGLRLAEMTSLQWNEINLMTGQLKVVAGKGNKDRILWINNKMLETLQNWREKQTKKLGQSEYVFCTRDLKKIKDTDVRNMVYKYSEKALDKKISPHTLRHTFATDLLRETKNIRLVQKTLGHADLSTTMIYTHIVDQELEDALKSFRMQNLGKGGVSNM